MTEPFSVDEHLEILRIEVETPGPWHFHRADVVALVVEVDRLRTEVEAAHRDAFEAAMAGLRLHAAWRSARRRANRVGHLYRQWRPEIDRLRSKLADAAKDSRKLRALRAAGVDNWEGYSDALAMAED